MEWVGGNGQTGFYSLLGYEDVRVERGPQGQAAPLPVEVRGLNKRYKNGTWANRDITFTVEPGELLAILGPNGAGKTTLVRQITTELLPTSGDVRVMGYSAVSEPSRVKSLMGAIPQEAALYHDLSVWHHLRAFGRLHGLSRKDSRARADEAGRRAPAWRPPKQNAQRAVGRPPPKSPRRHRRAHPPIVPGVG